MMTKVATAAGLVDGDLEYRHLSQAEIDEQLSVARFRTVQADLRAGFSAHGRKFDKWTDRQNEAWAVMAAWPWHHWPRPEPGSAPTSVALVGCAYEWRTAPWGEPGWEIWGLNDAQRTYGRPPLEAHTRWFQVHNPAYMAKHYEKGLRLMRSEWSVKTGVRLYMDRHYEEYPDSERLPVMRIQALTPRGSYHCSSFDWMLALALVEGFKKIALYGCDFYTPPVLNGEPLSARPCLEYWIGVADGMGAEVEVIGGGHLFKNLHLAIRSSDLQYGFDREPGLDLRAEDDAWMDVR